MKQKIKTLALFMLIWSGIQGQSFLTPLTSISGEAELTTVSGDKISGKIVAALTGMKGINLLTIKDTSGEKHKFNAEDIQDLKVKIEKQGKLEMIGQKTSNLEKLMNADFDELNDREYIYYQQIQVPGKDQFVLVQWLNPGFSQRIRVYEKPGAKSGETSVGGVTVSGNDFTAFYIILNGQVQEIKKKSYRKEDFTTLFGDCEKMVQFYEKPDFADFAEHILYYDLNCR